MQPPGGDHSSHEADPSSLSSIVTELSIQNRLLTKGYFLYEAASRSAVTQLKDFSTSKAYASPTTKRGGFLLSSSSSKHIDNNPISQLTIRLAEAELLIQNVTKILVDVIETQRSLPLALEGKNEGVSLPSTSSLSAEGFSTPPDSSASIVHHHKGSSYRHRSPSPSPGPRDHHYHASSDVLNGGESSSIITEIDLRDDGNVVVQKKERNSRSPDDDYSLRADTEDDDTDNDETRFGVRPELSEEMSDLINQAVERRDSFWRERIKDATETQAKMIEAQIKQSMSKRFSELIEAETMKVEKARAERDSLKAEAEDKSKELSELRKKVAELQTEVDAGMKIIHQFSQLMKDKASAVCQYCRRSGTLPPIPSR